MSKKNSRRKWGPWAPQLVSILFLTFALGRNPYSYYLFLRLVCCGIFAYLAVDAADHGKKQWTWILGVTAVIYNPVFRVHLNRDTWFVINVITILIAVASVFGLRRSLDVVGTRPEGTARSSREWLEERASAAPTMVRIVIDAIELRLQREFPQLLICPNWSKFKMVGTVGGCVSLAIFLHNEVPQDQRTPIELEMRKSLERGFPGAERLYENCARFVRDGLLQMERSKRYGGTFVLAGLWVSGVLNDGEKFDGQELIAAQIASVYQNEMPGYWTNGGA